MRMLATAVVLMAVVGSVQAQERAKEQTKEQAQPIEAMISTAMKAAIEEIAPSFERGSGHTLRVVYGPSGGIARRFTGGEAADLIVVDSKVLDELIKQGKVVPGRTDVARTGIGIAVRKGAPKPDVSSPDALRRALLDAKSIGHTAPAGGGVTAGHIERVFEKLGIAAQVASKVKLAAGGPDGRVSVLVSSGLLPAELQLIATISAGVATTAKQRDAAKAFIRHLTAPEAMVIYKAKGLAL
jgi:molybdate transport system substrate-binding protein